LGINERERIEKGNRAGEMTVQKSSDEDSKPQLDLYLDNSEMSTRGKGENEDRPDGDRGQCKSVWRVKGMTINKWGSRRRERGASI
jgi:hypothetical protein